MTQEDNCLKLNILKTNKELATRLRSEFPTEFLAKNPKLTQPLIDVAKVLEA